jgi:hypothetical protein
MIDFNRQFFYCRLINIDNSFSITRSNELMKIEVIVVGFYIYYDRVCFFSLVYFDL